MSHQNFKLSILVASHERLYLRHREKSFFLFPRYNFLSPSSTCFLLYFFCTLWISKNIWQEHREWEKLQLRWKIVIQAWFMKMEILKFIFESLIISLLDVSSLYYSRCMRWLCESKLKLKKVVTWKWENKEPEREQRLTEKRIWWQWQ